MYPLESFCVGEARVGGPAARIRGQHWVLFSPTVDAATLRRYGNSSPKINRKVHDCRKRLADA